MKILITFAVDDEFAPWRKLRPFKRIEEETEVEAYGCNVNGVEVGALLTGIGGKKDWAGAAQRIWNQDIEMCVSSGLAGGLRPGRSLGEVVAARQVEATSRKLKIGCDDELVDAAIRCGAREVLLMYSTDRVVVGATEKSDLGKIADVVEMESGEVLCKAAAFGARVAAIRGISDFWDEDLPIDFNRVVTAAGDVSIPRVIGQVLRQPTAIPSLVRFGKQSRAAAEKLALFLDRYVEALAALKTFSAGKVAS